MFGWLRFPTTHNLVTDYMCSIDPSYRKKQYLDHQLSDAEWILEYKQRLIRLHRVATITGGTTWSQHRAPAETGAPPRRASPLPRLASRDLILHQPHRIPLWVRFFLTTYPLLNPFSGSSGTAGSIHRLILSSTVARGIVYRSRDRSIIFLLRPYRMKSGAKVLPTNGSPSSP
jgi:hypothetical protein